MVHDSLVELGHRDIDVTAAESVTNSKVEKTTKIATQATRKQVMSAIHVSKADVAMFQALKQRDVVLNIGLTVLFPVAELILSAYFSL
jgi:mannose/fructose/N-acetylgalactosamine-specific phosphotransferase system component IIB